MFTYNPRDLEQILGRGSEREREQERERERERERGRKKETLFAVSSATELNNTHHRLIYVY